MAGFITTQGHEAAPIPLKHQGDPDRGVTVFHLLYAYDEQFKKLFKVKAILTTGGGPWTRRRLSVCFVRRRVVKDDG